MKIGLASLGRMCILLVLVWALALGGSVSTAAGLRTGVHAKAPTRAAAGTRDLSYRARLGSPYNPITAPAATFPREQPPAHTATGPGGLDWWLTWTTPAAQEGHAMAYDSARAVTVLYGGGETWEWDGTEWSHCFPAHTPVGGGAMAYDSARGVTVLFGDGGTWEWDGAEWTHCSPSHEPGARQAHALAYDSNRQATVLFGGYGNGSHLDDTWEWDGTDWTQRFPATVPAARDAHAMAYDNARGVTVLFGGTCPGALCYLDDTWEWDGTDWTQRFPASGPAAREAHAMAYDSARGVTVLFGGEHFYFDYEPWLVKFDDTWEWDGTGWTELAPANRPERRGSHAVAYDSTRGVTSLFGGYCGSPGEPCSLDDTWEWNGIDWIRRSPLQPDAGWGGHEMVYDSGRGVTVLFGGTDDVYYGYYFDHTWEWNGTDWTERTPTNRPRGRSGHAMAYDSAREVTVLFGGFIHTPVFDRYFDDTWLWDGTTWTERLPAHKPSARSNHAMAYDSARRVTVLFGGSSGGDETWEWDGTDWTRRSPAHTPAGGGAMAYDSRRGVAVLYGGGETWEWDGQDWTQRTPAHTPAGEGGMAYDSARGVTVLLVGGTWDSGETWEWDGTDWVQCALGHMPAGGGALAYDSGRGMTVLFRGTSDDSETWEYGPPLWRPHLAPIDNPDHDGDYLVAWAAVSEAITYTLEEDGSSAFASPTVRYTGVLTQSLVEGQADGLWYYRVRASNEIGESAWSEIEAVTVGWRVHLPLVARSP